MIKTIKVKHLYEHYPLYLALYGRRLDSKAFEAVGAAVALEHYANNFNPDVYDTGVNVLETFAGHSEHKPLFIQSSPVPVSSYLTMDIQEHCAEKGVIQGDAVTSDYPRGLNFILSFYYSVNSGLAEADGRYRREKLVQLFKNVYRNLDKGAYYFNHYDDGYRRSLFTADEITDHRYDLHAEHPMRKLFDLPGFGFCWLIATTHTVYDRHTCTAYDYFSDLSLYYEEKLIAKFKVAEPLTFRFWSEAELTDAVFEAGFSDIAYLNNSMGETMRTMHTVLDNKVEYPDVPVDFIGAGEGDNVKYYMSTDMMAVK